MEKGNVLVIEDRDVSRKNVRDSLVEAPFVDEVFEGKDLDSAIEAVESARRANKKIGAVVLDLQMPIGSAPDFVDQGPRKYGGVQIFEKLVASRLLLRRTPILIHSLYSYDFEIDEFRRERLNVIAKIDKFETGVSHTELRVWTARAFWPNLLPTGYSNPTYSFLGELPIIGEAKTLDKLAEQITDIYSPGSEIMNIFVEGRTGTGKELLARCLHYFSPYFADQDSFKRYPCGSGARTLIDSALFGHVAGAFNEARQRTGFLETVSDGSVVFLDQTEDLPLDCQAKLLDVLRERRFSHVGEEHVIKDIPSNVHFVVGAGSRDDVDSLVAKERYLPDILGRCFLRFRLKPLQECPDEIRLLVEYFAPLVYAQSLQRRLPEDEIEQRIARLQVDPSVWDVLRVQGWPQNRSQLLEAIVRACHNLRRTGGDVLGIDHFELRGIGERGEQEASNGFKPGLSVGDIAEAKLVKETLEKNNFNKSQTARELGWGRNRLDRKIEKYFVS